MCGYWIGNWRNFTEEKLGENKDYSLLGVALTNGNRTKDKPSNHVSLLKHHS